MVKNSTNKEHQSIIKVAPPTGLLVQSAEVNVLRGGMNSVRWILSDRHSPLGQVDHVDRHIQTVGDVVKDVLIEPLAPDNAPRAVPDEPVGALAFRQAFGKLGE